MRTAEAANQVFIPCPRCDGDGGKSFWPGFTCFKCDGLKGEWVDAKIYTRRLAARERAAGKRQAKWASDFAELTARREANWQEWSTLNPEFAARLTVLPESPVRNELIRYVTDKETVYQDWDTMISRVEGK